MPIPPDEAPSSLPVQKPSYKVLLSPEVCGERPMSIFLPTTKDSEQAASPCPCGDDTRGLAHVDLMVMQRSCSSFRVSVKRVSPARAEAMIPALHTRESVRVDLPWSTWLMTDMFRMLAFLSMMARIWSTVKFTMVADGGGFSKEDLSELGRAEDGGDDGGRAGLSFCKRTQ